MKDLPAELKSGMARDKEHRRRHFCSHHRNWIILGVVSAFLLLYGLAILIVLIIYDHKTYRSLKKCLPDMMVSEDMTELVVPSGRCNEDYVSILDLKHFTKLRNITVGDECFMYVGEVKIEGLKDLTAIQIGQNSFTTAIDSFAATYNSFYLTGCPSIKSLTIGSFSFSTYRTCIISNVPSLEKIDMESQGTDSYSFLYASLELKGILPCSV